MRPFRRLIALLLLLAYVSTGTSALPAFVVAAACVDGSHEVRIVRSEHGMQVRLHHEDEEHFTPEVADHSSVFTRVLVQMCAPAREGDHSLSTQFVSGSALLSREDDAAKRAAKHVQVVDLSATVQLLAQLPSSKAARSTLPKGEVQAPPTQALHACVSTVRLLI
ncbi:MAG TPA: hypothetical protein VGE39_03375 [Prosthecobacter sp.]